MTTYRLADEAREVPLPVFELFVGCKALEDPDGGWNGGDVVDLVTAWLTFYGLDPDSPVSRYVRESAPEDALQIHAKPNQDLINALDNEVEYGRLADDGNDADA